MAEKNQSQEVSGNLNDTTRQRYEQRIDELFLGSPAQRYEKVEVLPHSDILDMLGYGSSSVRLKENEVGNPKHPLMTATQWKQLPDWIENPAMVFYSDTVQGRLVFIAPEKVDNNDIRIIIEPKNLNGKQQFETHILFNAYDGSQTPTKTYESWIKDKNLLIYADTEKVSRIDKRVGLQLPKILNNPAFMPHSRIHSTSNGQVKATAKRTKILTQKNLIGYRKQREINLNQQIEQMKGNKMDEQQQATEQRQPENVMTEQEEHHLFIGETMAKYPVKDGEPFVVISASDYEDYMPYPPLSGTHKMSIQAAEMIFTHLDNEISRNGEEFVQRFEICNADGVAVDSINLRHYDLGRNNGGLFCYIAGCGILYHDDLLNLSQYLTQETRNGLIERIAQQAEVDNEKATTDEIYPKISIEKSKNVRNIFGERLQQQIQQQTTPPENFVEQTLEKMVEETIEIMNRQPESVVRHSERSEESQSKQQDSSPALQVANDGVSGSLNFQFTHTGLTEHNATINEKLNGLTAEQTKELTPYFEQHKAIQTLQDLYQQTGDSERLTEMQEHNRLLEWKIHNKVKGWTEKVADYADIDYYKGIDDNIAKIKQTENNQKIATPSALARNDGVDRQPESVSGKSFVQNFVENHANTNSQNATDTQNVQDIFSNANISDAKTFQEKVMFAKVEETEISKMIDDIAKQRLYLAVDFDHKDQAKAAGAKWDKVLSGWYVEKGNLNEALQAFLPQQPTTTIENRKPYSDFIAEAQKISIDLNSQNFKEEFGKWVRCPVKGKGKNNRDGGYKLFRNDDGSIGATAKNYSSGDSVNWCDKTNGEREVQSKVPLADFIANKKQAEWNEVAKNTVEHKVHLMRGEVAEKAYHQLENAKPDDPYIQKKGIENIGKLKRLDDGSTVVPLYHNGKIANLQMIPAYDSSQKRLMTQAEKMGTYYAIGNGKNPSVVIVAEGIATADSVHQIATELYGKDNVLTLSAIDSGNLKSVADKVDKVYPDAQKIIAADNDAHNATRAKLKFKNAGKDKANEVQQAYPDFQVALCPALTDEKGSVKNTDWNDFLKAHGNKQECAKRFSGSLTQIVKQQTATQQTTPQRKNGTDGRER